MGKLVVALTLITSLLVCPSRCSLSQVAAAPADECARPACCCCSQTTGDDLDSRSDGETPHNDCSCPDCICEGATLAEGPAIVAPDVDAALGDGLIRMAERLSSGASSRSGSRMDHAPPRSGGRDARVAFQVWLI